MSETTESLLRRRTAWLYEPLRRFFADREENHLDLRTALNRARIPVTLSGYLARSAVLSILAAAGGIVLGLVAAVVLVQAGALAGIDGPGWTGAVGGFVGRNRAVVAAVTLPLVLGLAFGLGTWGLRYYLPGRQAQARARRIDLMLPHAVTYLYALSRGGVGIGTAIERLAESEATYGEVAREMGMVVNHTEYLGADFMQAMQQASEVTPSTALSDFFEDLLNVVESGGDIEAFLVEKREEALQEARGTQASYLENISLFAEVYVSLVVAGALLGLILLMVLGILGSPTLPAVNILVYVGIPGVSLLAILGLDLLRGPFSQFRAARTTVGPESPERPDDPDAAAYDRRKRRYALLDTVRHPFRTFRKRPPTVLYLTVPIALAVAGVFVLLDTVEPTVTALYDAPVAVTTLLGVVPFVVATTPLMVFHELRQRRVDGVHRRFPDLLSSLSSANRMGIRLTEAIDNTTERADDVLARDLSRLNNEIGWFSEIGLAFRRAANRAQTGIEVRTLRLIADSNDASGNLSETLNVAARDARTQRELVRERIRELSSYSVASVVSFLVFLGVILMIDQFYFQEAVAVSQAAPTDGPELPATLSGIDVEGFELAFFHSALVQGLCIGLVTGKLTRGTVLAGLKYSLLLVAVTVAAFTVI
jgi:flagellar protein FlaJ